MSLSTRSERICLGILLLIFTCFTAHGLRMFFSGDDMMNMYDAWLLNPWRLGKSQLLIWMPVYRPLGGAVYRIFYAVFGFHNLPLYIFCWLLLALNAILSIPFFRALGATPIQALLALSLTLVHGNFQDLYLSAGTIYDRLWFLFTVLGVIVYARVRQRGGPIGTRPFVWLMLLSILSMDSKESGVALPVLLACYELAFIFPEARREGRIRAWFRHVAPLFTALAVLCLVFVFARVRRTPELMGTGAYQPRASISVWLTHLSEYLRVLTYGHVPFTPLAAVVLLVVMAAAAVALRNRGMIFGLLFFLITITPVALITARPGYVLYVPDLGLGLYLALAAGQMLRPAPRLEFAVFALVTVAMTVFHIRNWPGPFPPEVSPEYRFTHQFRTDYPSLPPGSKLLFVNDDFPPTTWDLVFNARLFYHDRSLLVHRLMAPADQQAKPGIPVHYDHVFIHEWDHYLELDPRDVKESVRLHILRDYTVGREMDFSHADHIAYVVNGVIDGPGSEPARWTRPEAKFKYDLYPAPAFFTAKFWLPDYVATPNGRSLTVLVNGVPVGAVPLNRKGTQEIRFPVDPSVITKNGFTLVDMNTDHPYSKDGEQFGVMLMRAGFEYR